MKHGRTAMIWGLLVTAVIVPLALASNSPLLQWRDPIYVAAGYAGVIALALLLFQPLLASHYLPGLSINRRRQIHHLVGAFLLVTIIIHVAGLWITSPPDVIDALLFRSPTSFSIWGVVAMWATFSTASLVAARSKLQIAPNTWRSVHQVLAAIIVVASVVHALLIEGTMELFSKLVLCTMVLIVTFTVLIGLFYQNRGA